MTLSHTQFPKLKNEIDHFKVWKTIVKCKNALQSWKQLPNRDEEFLEPITLHLLHLKKDWQKSLKITKKYLSDFFCFFWVSQDFPLAEKKKLNNFDNCFWQIWPQYFLKSRGKFVIDFSSCFCGPCPSFYDLLLTVNFLLLILFHLWLTCFSLVFLFFCCQIILIFKCSRNY